MSIKTTKLIRCDHIHTADNQQCTVERTQDRIAPTEPMYHLTIEIEVIDADGIGTLIKEDVHLCYWDLYYHMAGYHERAKAAIEEAKEAALQHAEAMQNDD